MLHSRASKKKRGSSRLKRSRLKEYYVVFLAFLLFFLALFLRLRFVVSPIVDFHWMRQCHTAAVARNFHLESMNIFYPRIDERGETEGYVEMEFPAYPFLIAVLYRIFGIKEVIGRVVSIVFAAGTFVLIFLISKRLIGEIGSLGAVSLFAFSPLAVYFTRTFQPESMLLFSASLSYYFFLKWLESRKNSHAAIWIISASMAMAMKIPVAVILFFLFLGTGLSYLGLNFLKDPRTYIFAALAAAPPLLWTVHAASLFRTTGLSFSRWLMNSESILNPRFFLSSDYWAVVINQRFIEDLTLPGFIAVILGLVFSFKFRHRLAVMLGNLGFLIYFFVFTRANYAHHYYQLTGIIPASLSVACLFEYVYGIFKERNLKASPVFISAFLLLFTALGTASYYAITKPWYNLATVFVHAGEMVKSVTSPADKVITVNEHGAPEIFYFAERKGWNLAETPSPEEVKALHEKGAGYICVLKVSREQEKMLEKLQILKQSFKVVYEDMAVAILKLE